ncbi:hypothetical protein V6N13_067150 [Hibiscus sabdariffa]
MFNPVTYSMEYYSLAAYGMSRFCFASHQACSGGLGPCSSVIECHVGLALRQEQFSMVHHFTLLQMTYVSVITETLCRCRLILLALSCPCVLVDSAAQPSRRNHGLSQTLPRRAQPYLATLNPCNPRLLNHAMPMIRTQDHKVQSPFSRHPVSLVFNG